MPLWEKIAFTVFTLAMLYYLYPGMLAAMDRSKQAEEKHWGTVLVLAAVLAVFILLLISVVRQ